MTRINWDRYETRASKKPFVCLLCNQMIPAGIVHRTNGVLNHAHTECAAEDKKTQTLRPGGRVDCLSHEVRARVSILRANVADGHEGAVMMLRGYRAAVKIYDPKLYDEMRSKNAL